MKILTAREKLAAAESQVDALRKEARDEAIREIQERINRFELGPRELQWPKGKQPRGEVREGDGRSVVPVRYKDPVTGIGWSGRGTLPKWLMAYVEAGRDRHDFLTEAGRDALAAHSVSQEAPSSSARDADGSPPISDHPTPDASDAADDDEEPPAPSSSPGMH